MRTGAFDGWRRLKVSGVGIAANYVWIRADSPLELEDLPDRDALPPSRGEPRAIVAPCHFVLAEPDAGFRVQS